MRRVITPLVFAAMTCLAGCHVHHAALLPSPLTASPKAIDSLWNAALDLYAHQKWEKAGVAFDRAELELPLGDHRTLLGRLYLGDIYMHSNDELEAVREYRRLSDDYPSDSLSAVALLHAGDAYFKLWRRPELDPTYGYNAQATYTELLNRYPGTPAAADATKRVADLNNWFAEKQYKNGVMYLKWKAYDSAVLYFKDIAATWPQAKVVPDAVLGLIQAYTKLGYLEDVRDMCDYLRKQYPSTPQLATRCKAAPAAATTPAPAKPKGP
ncbi:MAG TPA: outer membrane protein assembly factor BamD [Gemmatimonadales bacterium]|jgi:outer membrane protein assembly factor BamD|nr:outer membrane protein assembly factor BamD [Gemmatimonadales bacterium]